MAERSKALRSGFPWYPPGQIRSLERGVSSNLTVVNFLFCRSCGVPGDLPIVKAIHTQKKELGSDVI